MVGDGWLVSDKGVHMGDVWGSTGDYTVHVGDFQGASQTI